MCRTQTNHEDGYEGTVEKLLDYESEEPNVDDIKVTRADDWVSKRIRDFSTKPEWYQLMIIIVVGACLFLIILSITDRSTSNPSGNEMAGGSAAPASPENAKSPATAFPQYSNFIFTCKQLHRLDKDMVDKASFYTTNAGYQNAINERLQGLRNMSDFPKMQSDLGKLQQAIRGRDVFKFLSLWQEVLVSCENVIAPDP